MIIKLQSVLFPYVRHRETKTTKVLTKSDRVFADRVMMAILFAMIIAAAVAFS